MRIHIPLTLLAASLLTLGCGSPKAGRDARDYHYNMEESTPSSKGHFAPVRKKPNTGQYLKVFEPCTMGNGGTSAHSWAASIITIKERGWVVDNMDFKGRKIQARICHHTSPDLCASFVLSAQATGHLIVSSAKTIPENLRDDVVRWMGEFEKTYSIARCYTDETLNAELNKFGMELPPTSEKNAVDPTDTPALEGESGAK